MGSVDYVPTILDICQAKIPDNMKIDGVSYKSVLEGNEKLVRNSLHLKMGYARAIKTSLFVTSKKSKNKLLAAKV